MKMNLQRRSNLGTRERFQGSYLRGCLILLGLSDEFLFCNNFNDHKMHFIRTRNIFPHSREGNHYFAAAIHSFRRMNRDIPLGKNS